MESLKPSLSEVNSSVETKVSGGLWKRLFAFLGPAYLISVGYMDPGNWATDIAGGSEFGYRLIWVLFMSNLIALLLQGLSIRLGVVRGLDLAQASKEAYPSFINFYLYLLAEIAIAACDLAEVLGMAIGLQLLFGLPLLHGVCLTVLDAILLLYLQNYGMRKLEAFILALVAIIGAAFLTEMIFAKPVLGEVAVGLIPSLPNDKALYIAIGIIGATVMPHNLYLHSSLVQTRKIDRSHKGILTAIRYNLIDAGIALNLAFFVNAAILILAGTAFFKNGFVHVGDIKDAYQLLEPLLGSHWAPTLFAIALIAAGQSSTITGTLAGQVVMEGYLNLRIQPWVRRLLTRSLAILPAIITISLLGEKSAGSLLVLSQVILSLQLGFAIIPLIHFVSHKKKMKEYAIGKTTKFFSWLCAIIIVGLNIRLVVDEVSEWITTSAHPGFIYFTVIPLIIFSGFVLLYVILTPFIAKYNAVKRQTVHKNVLITSELTHKPYHRIAITIDFSASDQTAINHALSYGGKNAEYVLIHVVETAGALFLGNEISDHETSHDLNNIKSYVKTLQAEGFQVKFELGYGSPKKAIPELVKSFNADLLVMAGHGHKMLKDIFLGTTVEAVRHSVSIPMLVVRE